MELNELMDRVRSHFIWDQLDLELQLGNPFFYLKDGALCVRFWPHRERVEKTAVTVFRPACRVDFAEPFLRVCRYEELTGRDAPQTDSAVLRTETAIYFSNVEKLGQKLRPLEERLLRKECPEEELNLYREALKKELNALGLLPVYGAEVEESCFT